MPDNSKRVAIGLVQLRCLAEPERNLTQAVEQIRLAAGQGAQIVCLPELFRSLYFCQREDHACFKLAESIPGPTTECSRKLAKELGVVIIASLFEKRAEGLYHNTAVVIDADGAMLGKYRKMHIPDDPLYYEKFYFTPGDLGFQVFPSRFSKLGVLVCWDQWYPEAARLTALRGAEILVLSDGHRLASGGKSRIRAPPAPKLGPHPALACHGQRLLCRERQPHGA